MPGLALKLDHFVLTVSNLERTVHFYRDVLGLEVETFGKGRLALRLGEQKINLHCAGQEFAPHAQSPLPGSADFCLLVAGPLAEVQKELEAKGVPIELGPVKRTGSRQQLLSLYVRDPDGNLVELAQELV